MRSFSFVAPLSFSLLILLALVGCSMFGTNPGGPAAPGGVSTEKAPATVGTADSVSFRIVLPDAQPTFAPSGSEARSVSFPEPRINHVVLPLAASTASPTVTFILKLVNVGDINNLVTTLSKTVPVNPNGTAEACFSGVPARPCIGDIHISGGSVGGFNDFHGSKDLEPGKENTILLAPKGSEMPEDVSARIIGNLVQDPELHPRIQEGLCSKINDAISGLDPTLPDYFENSLKAYLNGSDRIRCEILSPVDFANLMVGAGFNLVATASAQEGLIARVDIYNGSECLGCDDSPPFEFYFSGLPQGVFRLRAVARHSSGVSKSSPEITITTNFPGNQPPTVRLMRPVGAERIAQAQGYRDNRWPLEVLADDPDGAISRIEFFIDDLLVASLAGPLHYYISSWVPAEGPYPVPKVGLHYASAKAYDDKGAVALSNKVLILLMNRNPIGEFTSPAWPAVFSAGDNIDFNVSASDTDGIVKALEIRIQGGCEKILEHDIPGFRGANFTDLGIAQNTAGFLASFSSGPFSCTLANAPPGGYFFEAWALDNDGGKTPIHGGTLTVNPRRTPIRVTLDPATYKLNSGPAAPRFVFKDLVKVLVDYSDGTSRSFFSPPEVWDSYSWRIESGSVLDPGNFGSIGGSTLDYPDFFGDREAYYQPPRAGHGTVNVVFSYGENGGSSPIVTASFTIEIEEGGQSKNLKGISLDPASDSVGVGEIYDLSKVSVIGTYDDGSTATLFSGFTWSGSGVSDGKFSSNSIGESDLLCTFDESGLVFWAFFSLETVANTSVRFTKDSDGVITDNTTGMKWKRCPDDYKTWLDASIWAQGVGSNWGLPSISDFEKMEPTSWEEHTSLSEVGLWAADFWTKESCPIDGFIGNDVGAYCYMFGVWPRKGQYHPYIKVGTTQTIAIAH